MKRRTAALLVVGALVLGACKGSTTTSGSGGSDKKTTKAEQKNDQAPEAVDFVLASATTSAEFKTVHFEMRMTMPGPDGRTLNVTMTGGVDTEAPLMVMNMDLGSMLGEEMGSGNVQMLFDGEALYMQMPEALPEAGGKRWMRLDLSALGADPSFGELLTQLQSADPRNNWAQLEGVKEAEELGTEDIRGVSTRHFRVKIDVTDALAEMPAEAKAAFAEVYGDTKELEADVWIDDDGTIRRMAMDIDLSKANLPELEGVPTGAIHMEMDFFDYDRPVEAKIPAASETFDFSEMMG